MLHSVVQNEENFIADRMANIRQLPAAYLSRARPWQYQALVAQAAAAQGFHGDTVAFDASRASCKELLLVHMLCNAVLVCAPAQVLSDQPAAHSPAAALRRVADALASKAQGAHRHAAALMARRPGAWQMLWWAPS